MMPTLPARLDAESSPRNAVQDHVGGLLRDHVDRCHDEIAGYPGKYRGVNDAKIVDAVNAELAVDHAALILGLHGAGAASVMSPGVVRDVVSELGFGIEMASRALLLGNQMADGVGDLAAEPDPGDH